jgi:hypothetical protein
MKLLAATRFFETYLVETDGETWLYHRYGSKPSLVESAYSSRMTAENDWLIFDEEFNSLEDLEDRVDELVPRAAVALEDFPLSATLARAFLPLLEELKEPDQLTERHRTLIKNILELPSVKADHQLKTRLERFDREKP